MRKSLAAMSPFSQPLFPALFLSPHRRILCLWIPWCTNPTLIIPGCLTLNKTDFLSIDPGLQRAVLRAESSWTETSNLWKDAKVDTDLNQWPLAHLGCVCFTLRAEHCNVLLDPPYFRVFWLMPFCTFKPQEWPFPGSLRVSVKG